MKISTNTIQQCIQDVETKQNGILEERDMAFQGMMFQIISMMNMETSESQGNERNLTQDEGILSIANPQQEILMDAIDNLNSEDYKSIKMNKELLEIVEKIIKIQDHQPVKDQAINLQNNDELNKILKKIDMPLEKILIELKAIMNPHEEGQAEHLDIKRMDKTISFFQEKAEDGQKPIKASTTKASLLGERPEDTKGTLAEKKNINELSAKDMERTKKPHTKDIITNNHSGSIYKTIEHANEPRKQVEIQNIHEISKDMIKEIKVLKSGEQSNLQLKLRPKELGEIEVQLEMKAGRVVGKILVESMDIKGAIENQLQHLKEQLRNHNIVTQEIEVDLHQHKGGEYQNNRHSFFWDDATSSNFARQVHREDEETISAEYARQPLAVNSYYSRGQAPSLNLLA